MGRHLLKIHQEGTILSRDLDEAHVFQVLKQVHEDMGIEDSAVKHVDQLMFNLLSNIWTKRTFISTGDIECSVLRQVLFALVFAPNQRSFQRDFKNGR